MTNNNPAPGNNPGMTALMAHVSSLHSMAIRLETLLLTISLFQEAEDANERMTLVDIAMRVSKDLGNGMDSVTLREVVA